MIIILRGQDLIISPVPLSYYERLDCNWFFYELILIFKILLLGFLELFRILVLDSEHCQFQLVDFISYLLSELLSWKSVFAVYGINILYFPFCYYLFYEVGFHLFLGFINQFFFFGLLDLLLWGLFGSFLFFANYLQSFLGFFDLLSFFFNEAVDTLYQIGLLNFLSLFFLFHGLQF